MHTAESQISSRVSCTTAAEQDRYQTGVLWVCIALLERGAHHSETDERGRLQEKFSPPLPSHQLRTGWLADRQKCVGCICAGGGGGGGGALSLLIDHSVGLAVFLHGGKVGDVLHRQLSMLPQQTEPGRRLAPVAPRPPPSPAARREQATNAAWLPSAPQPSHSTGASRTWVQLMTSAPGPGEGTEERHG